MKKFSFLASSMLTLCMMYSCIARDNAVFDEPDGPAQPTEQKTTIALDGVEYEVGTVATLKGEVGSEVTLTIGVYDAFDIYGVDFGDGNIVADTVCFQNGGLKDADGISREDTNHKSATKFTGTVAGDGTITVYGESDVWYLNLTGSAVPTTFDQEKLLKAVQVSVSGANVESVELPQMDSLKQFTFNNSPVAKVDVSKAVNLTSLTINTTSVSKYEPQLKSIDLSKNVNLESLQIMATQAKPGKLASIDLTANTKLTGLGLYLQYNELTSLQIGENTLTTVNLSGNKLTEFEAAKFPKLKSLYISDNELTSIDLTALTALTWVDLKNNKLAGDLDLTFLASLTNLYVNNNQLTGVSVTNVTKQFYFDNNQMTLATMPALPAGMNTTSKKKQFHYAPQAAMKVVPQGAVVDLSAQASAKGMESEAQTTVFTVKAGTATLTAGTDYTEKGGVITFLTSQKGVVVEMTNAGYPALTLATEAFDVEAAAVKTPMAWDFSRWSEATIANLKADAAASATEGWSNIEKAADAQDASKAVDGCYWLQGSLLADGALGANGVEIAELKGLKFDTDYCGKRSLAIAVNYPSTSLGDYAGGAYLWLGGGGKKQTCPCFTIPGVKEGAVVTVVAESHKPTDARGIQIYANSYEAANQIGDAFTPTTKDTHTWNITADCDVVVWNTSGCHLYSVSVSYPSK